MTIKTSDTSFLSYEEKYELAFKDFPSEDLFRLFIDKKAQDKGEYAFDKGSLYGNREKGYRDAMVNAFAYMKKTIGKELNADELKEIRSICINKVKGLNDRNLDFSPAGYGIVAEHVSEGAIKEWESDKLILTGSIMKKIDERITDEEEARKERKQFLAFAIQGSVSSTFTESRDLPQIIDGFFEHYYSAIKNAKTDDDKLGEIVSLCRKLEISHLFSDANQRTIVFVILNKLLIENGFCPVILEDPSVFDGYHSKEELVQDVKKGMENFLACKAEKKETETLTSNSNISSNYVSSSQQLTKENYLKTIQNDNENKDNESTPGV